MNKGMLEKHRDDYLKFLGTAGARFVVARQLRASGGLWLSAGGLNILIDPGPGSLVKCFSSRPKLNPYSLDGIILTHRHLDHSNDVNVMIEAMTNGGFNKRGFLMAPRDALEGENPVVQLYLHQYLDKIELFGEGKRFHFPSFTLETPIRHNHPVETYGLKFFFPYGKVFLIVDTAFFPALIEHYRNADILVLNVAIFKIREKGKVFHLDLEEAREIIKEIRPQAAILTHFGMTMLHKRPHLLAARMQEELGIKIIAAGDGLKLSLPDLLPAFSGG
ncbi:MAG TPA: MBL fold metallo-hydrolase [Firmicutes bacterium]|nr:MBL fold metallo-hydrolase [Bacillota bacterium]